MNWMLFFILVQFMGAVQASDRQTNKMVLDTAQAMAFSSLEFQAIDLSFDEIKQHSKGWKHAPSAFFDAGFSTQIYWFRQDLFNPTKNNEWFLTLNNTRLDFVDFYLISDEGLQHLSSGDHRDISGQLSSLPTFKFNVKSDESAQLYVRVQSETKIAFEPTLRGSFRYGKYLSERKSMHILYAIILCVFIIAQVALHRRITDSIALYSILGLFFGFAYNLFYLGEGNLLLWPDNSAIKDCCYYVCAMLCCGFFSLVLQHYLHSETKMPTLHSMLKMYLFFDLIGLIIILFPVGNSLRLTLVILATVGLTCFALYGTIRAVLRESCWFLWFTTPLIFTMIAALVYVSAFLDIVPYTPVTSSLLLWSFLLDTLFISITLMFRHRALRNERNGLLHKLSEFSELQSDPQKNGNITNTVIVCPSDNVIDKALNRRLNNINPNATIIKLIQYLDTEKVFLEPGLTVDNVASSINVRSDQLSVLISTELKTSFPTLINIKRLEAAAKLLKDYPNKHILNVSLECGFNSKSNFNRLFKEYFQTTPSLYRKLAT